jgi:hypothetical protein
MDIEHFGLLSSVIRKTESHEQDGETLRAKTRIETASGNPAMALRFQSVGTDGPFRPALLGSPFESCHTTAGACLRMIFSENRYPLFGIMLTPAYSARGN